MVRGRSSASSGMRPHVIASSRDRSDRGGCSALARQSVHPDGWVNQIDSECGGGDLRSPVALEGLWALPIIFQHPPWEIDAAGARHPSPGCGAHPQHCRSSPRSVRASPNCLQTCTIGQRPRPSQAHSLRMTLRNLFRPPAAAPPPRGQPRPGENITFFLIPYPLLLCLPRQRVPGCTAAPAAEEQRSVSPEEKNSPRAA